MRFPHTAVLLFILVLLTCFQGVAPCRPDTPETRHTWRFEGGTWKTAGDLLTGTVDQASRGFAAADDQRLSFEVKAEVLLTPRKHVGASWSAAGLCVYRDLGSYWRLALVESPGAKTHSAELIVMNDGQGFGPANLTVREQDPPSLAWSWNTPYRLRLSMEREQITGEVLSADGKRLWHIVYSLTAANLPHFGRLAVGVQGMEASFSQAAQEVPARPLSPVISRMLRQNGEASAWLTLPQSRLVVNPTMSSVPTAPPQSGPSLPLNLAWYSGPTPVRLPGFWAWQPTAGDAVEATRPLVTAGPVVPLTPESDARFRTERASVTFENGAAQLRVNEVPFGSLSTEVKVDLDRTPFLTVSVPRSDGGWALKVNAGNAAVDTYVQTDTTQTGTFTFDLRKPTGWSGSRTFRVILFALGTKGDASAFTNLRFVGASSTAPALKVKEAAWFPHQLTRRAEVEGPGGGRGVSFDSTVFMPDESSVSQRLIVRGGNPGTLVLCGEVLEGSVRWDAARQALLVSGSGFHAALSVSGKVRFLGTYATGTDRLAGRRSAPGELAKAWALALDDLHSDDEVEVAATFGMPEDPQNAQADSGRLVSRAKSLASGTGFAGALTAREEDWDRRLGSLPHPLSFALSTIEPRGADAELVRRAYYRAWVFLLSDTLPPMPENGYPYPQFSCGKPSLWAEGARQTRATSQWESVLGMQYAALVEPDTAWSAFEGLLSLVSASGVLEGEGLPTRNAQTAWTLYSLTGDRTRLAGIYPALKRLLLWKAADPRWLYKGSTPAGQKDSEFVVHALMDMGFAQRIARALDKPEDVTFWQDRIDRLAADFHGWFWDGGADGGLRTYRIFDSASGQRKEPDRMWNLQGLALPEPLLTPEERDTYLKMFRAGVKESVPFLIPELAGFPKYNYTLHGTWQYGAPDEAARMAEAAMREIALAGEFSENYTQSFPPAPAGVVPSLFGALQAIDGALWRNGVRMGQGSPQALPMPRAAGVWNLLLRGQRLAIVLDEHAKRLELQGQALSRLLLPSGMKSTPLADATPRWLGPLPPRKGLALDPTP